MTPAPSRSSFMPRIRAALIAPNVLEHQRPVEGLDQVRAGGLRSSVPRQQGGAMADGDPVVYGRGNTENGTTSIQNTGGNTALACNADGGDAIQGVASSGVGLDASSVTGVGVVGRSDSATGVRADSQSGYGLSATSISRVAAFAESQRSDGVVGRHDYADGPGAGVQGFSAMPASPAPLRVGVRGVGIEAGVAGEADQDGDGVRGTSDGGAGVRG